MRGGPAQAQPTRSMLDVGAVASSRPSAVQLQVALCVATTGVQWGSRPMVRVRGVHQRAVAGAGAAQAQEAGRAAGDGAHTAPRRLRGLLCCAALGLDPKVGL